MHHSPTNPVRPTDQVAAWLAEQPTDAITHRAIHQRFRSQTWARTSADLARVLATLEHQGHVTRGRRHASSAYGGRPSTVWIVSPALRATSGVPSSQAAAAAAALAMASAAIRDTLDDHAYAHALPHLEALRALVTDDIPRSAA